MTTGNIIGGIIGAVVGWFAGGPMGAFVGFSIGMGIGGIIDPFTPDSPAPGDPASELDVMTSVEGLPMADVLGTAKMSGNLLTYGNNWRKTITEEVETGIFSSEEQVVGYQWYLSWAMGFCIGPIDTLYTVYFDEDVVWSGNLALSDATNGEASIILSSGDRNIWADVEDEDSGELIDFENEIILARQIRDQGTYIGVMTFYFGTPTQVVNTNMTEFMVDEGVIDDATWAIPYRNQCYGYMHNCVIGTYNRCPSIKVVVRKAPNCSFDP